jgi:hypothetical protein
MYDVGLAGVEFLVVDSKGEVKVLSPLYLSTNPITG